MEDASLTTKGVVKLSSAVDSTSESLAATPKAVKAANDNANSRLAKNQNGADIPDKGRFLSNINVYSKGEVDKKKGMRKYTFSAPANAVSGKWYPVVFRRTGGGTDELASRVVITTYSSAGGYAMNNCEFNGFVMPGGWSDRGSYAAGFFSIYSTAERAIHSIIASVKDDDLCSVFYVETRAFPIQIFAEEGLNVIVPTADYAVGQTTYKWGATDPLSESTNAQIILDFKNGRGYYCSHPFISSLSGNAATATKLQTARSIGGVVFDGSANINLPGVNTTGNQNTTGNAATATKLQTVRKISGVPFDGSTDITLTAAHVAAFARRATGSYADADGGVPWNAESGAYNVTRTGDSYILANFYTGVGSCRTLQIKAHYKNGGLFYRSSRDGYGFESGWEQVYTTGFMPQPADINAPTAAAGWLNSGNGTAFTTAQFITWLNNQGAFTNKHWIARCSWTYANNNYIDDTGCGRIDLSGSVIEVFSNKATSHYTIRVTTTTTSGHGGVNNAEFIYVYNGSDYAPGWRRSYNTRNKPTASDVGALPLSGGTLSGGLTSSGEIVSKYANGFRIAYGNYGFFIRNDGSNTYFMLTASGDTLGSWNGLRPIIINNTSGAVTIGNGLNVTGGINGSLNGNAATATKLQTARTIGGVSFDGSANIDLPGVNTTGNQNTTGNAATATKLATARNINGVKFDGSGDININTLVSRGPVTALSGSTQGTAGIQMYEAYNNSYPTTYGNVLHMKGASAAGEGELLIGWSGTDGAHAPVYVRSRRDTSTANWSGWAQVYTTAHKPTAADVGALPISGGTMTGVLTLQNVSQPLKTQGGGILANDGNLYINKSGFAGWIDALFMKNSGGTMSGQLKIRSTDGLRIYDAAYGMIFRRSENNFYLIPTAKDQGENGDIGSLRPFYVDLTNGRVTMGNGAVVNGGLGLGVVNGLGGNSIVLGDNDTGFKQNGDGILDVYANSAHVFRFVNSTLQSLKPLSVTGDIASSAWVYANRFSINSGSGAWIDMRNQNVIFGGNAVSTNSAQALLRQDHADRKFFLGGLGNSQFGFYMINNSRTANGTDAAAYLQNDGTWVCAGNGSFNDVYIRSDRRSKRNIRKIERALDKLEQIEGVLYEIQVCGRYEQSGGLIAQDVQNVQPELVTVDHNDQSGEPRLRLNYNGVIGMLVEAVKELREEVRELKAKM
ncbi:tail fiber protein [Escherichia coli]|uniref:phage tail fiber protein n=1 Tax=Escherichia coli TaxID=562 RepID=UPI0039C8AAFC